MYTPATLILAVAKPVAANFYALPFLLLCLLSMIMVSTRVVEARLVMRHFLKGSRTSLGVSLGHTPVNNSSLQVLARILPVDDGVPVSRSLGCHRLPLVMSL
jgi:hypothetical protein